MAEISDSSLAQGFARNAVLAVQSGDSNGRLAVAAISVLTLLLVWQLLVLVNFLHRRRLPPGPQPWPIVGNFPSIASALPHRALQKLSAKYGGLMFLRMGMQECIVVSTVDVAKEIFQHHDVAFSNRPPGLAAEIMTGYKDMVFAPYGPHWRHLRQLCNTEILGPKSLGSLENARTEEIHNMMRVLREQSRRGEVTNLKQWLYCVMCNNITRMALNKRFFGTNSEHDQQETEDFQTMMAGFLEVFGAFLISDFIPYLMFVTKLLGWEKRIKEVRKTVFGVCANMMELEARRQHLKEGNINVKEQDFTNLLLSTEDKDGLSDESLMLILLDLLIAGTETSATTVEWAMTEVIRNPDVLRKVQAEINSVVGMNRLVQESDIPSLLYLQAVVKEVFRLHPPIPLSLPRETSKAVNILGFNFKTGTRLILNLFAIHRDPCVYKNPDEFIPERFLEELPNITATTGFDSYQLKPFGIGRRMCPGAGMGNLMVHITLAHMLQNFDWSYPSNGDPHDLDVDEAFAGALSRKSPLKLMAIPKHSTAFY